jgi:hypothetical protein
MDIESLTADFSEIKETLVRIEMRLEYFTKDVNEAFSKIRDVEERIGNIETQVISFKGQIKGAYIVLGIAASVLVAILARTGVISRIFGG